MLKTCFKCHVEKPITEFYKHPQMGDGYVGKCKDCNKVDVRENYAKRRGQYQDYEAARNQEPGRKAALRAASERHRIANPEKNRARARLKYAIRTGKMSRQPCEVCGELRTEAHHTDYSKPLDVRWLCFLHHREDHGQESLSGYQAQVAHPAAAD